MIFETEWGIMHLSRHANTTWEQAGFQGDGTAPAAGGAVAGEGCEAFGSGAESGSESAPA